MKSNERTRKNPWPSPFAQSSTFGSSGGYPWKDTTHSTPKPSVVTNLSVHDLFEPAQRTGFQTPDYRDPSRRSRRKLDTRRKFNSSPQVCYLCREVGHIHKNCPEAQQESAPTVNAFKNEIKNEIKTETITETITGIKPFTDDSRTKNLDAKEKTKLQRDSYYNTEKYQKVDGLSELDNINFSVFPESKKVDETPPVLLKTPPPVLLKTPPPPPTPKPTVATTSPNVSTFETANCESSIPPADKKIGGGFTSRRPVSRSTSVRSRTQTQLYNPNNNSSNAKSRNHNQFKNTEPDNGEFQEIRTRRSLNRGGKVFEEVTVVRYPRSMPSNVKVLAIHVLPYESM